MPDRQPYPLYDRASSTTRAASGSSRTRAAGRAGESSPLALAGLGSLGHRGAFAADGESSDGAGRAAPARAERSSPIWRPVSAVVRVVLMLPPRQAADAAAARWIVEAALAEERLRPAWRDVPVDPTRARPGGAPSPGRPSRRPSSNGRAGWRLPVRARASSLARRRMEDAARMPARSSRVRRSVGVVAERSSTRAWSPAARLAAFYPDLARGAAGQPRVFHQRYATNTHPDLAARAAVPADRPQRRDQHGAGNREPGARARRRPRRPRIAGTRLVETGPLARADGSDSLSLDEALELLAAGLAARRRRSSRSSRKRRRSEPPATRWPDALRPPDRRARRAVGRPRRAGVRRRPPRRGDARPERPASAASP